MAEPAGRAALRAADAYRLWAPAYDPETAVSALEDRVVRRLGPSPEGRSLLDVGCGTGRRLPPARAGARVVGVDLVPDMLARGVARAAREGHGLVAADVLHLPLRSGRFDLVWCRLVLGHLADPSPAYAELARVCRPGGALVVTDFHERAVAAGHRRTFRDPEGVLRAVEHHVHGREAHEAAAVSAGWRVVEVVDAAAGDEERGFYETAGRLDQLDAERHLSLVLAVLLARDGAL